MILFFEIEPYCEPINIFEKIGERKTELSNDSLSFICGVIKENKPHKIVEVGVSAGGTSCVIMKCLENLNLDSKVYSVDLAYTYHYNELKPCGYQLQDAQPYLTNINNNILMLGKTIAEQIDKIMEDGKKIDMLILDTIHYLPGELLDFIVCMPFLAKKACVICDDLLFAHEGENTQALATKVLFDTVVADKLILKGKRYENLMGFQLNEHSWMYKENYFSALFSPWWYYPSEEIINVYRNKIKMNYSSDALALFDASEQINKKTVQNLQTRKVKIQEIMEICKKNKTLIYGAGKRGTALNYFLHKQGYDVEGYVISDDRSKFDFSYMKEKIYNLCEIVNKDYCILIAVADNEVRENIKQIGLKVYDVPNYVFPFLKEYQSIVNNQNL